jgi:hypothetical protein
MTTWEDQLERIRNVTKEMQQTAVLLELALDSAESCTNTLDREIRQRAKSIADSSKK